MELLFSEEEKMLRSAARDFLEKECPKSLVRQAESDPQGYSLELWRKMAALGWLGMMFPREYGGSEGSFVAAAIIAEEMGRAAAPVPFFSTIAVGGLLVLEAGSPAQKEAILPGVIRGEKRLSLALLEPGAENDPARVEATAVANGDRYLINGTKLFVPDAETADHLICEARTGRGQRSLSLFLVDGGDSGLKCAKLDTIASDRQYEVGFQNVAVPKQNLLGKLNQGWRPLRRVLVKATALKCAEMLGVMQKALEIAMGYSRTRIQFGQPIGSFQAVHHHFVDMYKDIEICRVLTYQACWRLGQGLPAEAETSMSKARVNSALRTVTSMAHQINGGSGYFADYDLQLYYRRGLAGQVTIGGTEEHLKTVADKLFPVKAPAERYHPRNADRYDF